MTTVSRRHLVSLGLGAVVVSPIPAWAFTPPQNESRELSFNNIHTSERTRCLYFDKGHYVPDALENLNHFLRDWRTNDVHPIDPALFDQINVLQGLMQTKGEFNIICGFRSAKTNAALHERSTGVATHSQHLVGKAIDLNLDGKDLSYLHKAALSLRSGGVGYYPSSNFIHLDTGPVRKWG
jgi:uncharacterized protein YcbK (DUF882 family)